MSGAVLPIPPPEMRALVGQTAPSGFDNPSGAPIFDFVDPAAFRSVFDFGCGCGRLARQLIQQQPRPQRYLGIDLHAGMIAWCQHNLARAAPGFEFAHHDVYNFHFNPGNEKPRILRFPVEDRAFTLVTAWSVFTHLNEGQAVHYLQEVARILAPGGVFHSTWFLFDKYDGFPMMTDSQNVLYVSDLDPSAAAIFDRSWVRRTAADAGLVIYQVWPVRPAARGFQWHVLMAQADGRVAARWPADDREQGWNQPPAMPEGPARIGLNPMQTPATPILDTHIA